MEIFRTLTIQLDAEAMARVIEGLTPHLPEGWTRDRETEEGLRKVGNKDVTYCFVYTDVSQQSSRLLFLNSKDLKTFEVPNITVLTGWRLTVEQYNELITLFAEAITPFVRAESGELRLGPTQQELEHWMSPATAEALRQFSRRANRNVAAGLPADRERWNAFVLAAHTDQCKMTPEELRRWLTEEERWFDTIAERLADEYQYKREILAFEHDTRRSA
jgi:hypothetical protein